VSRFIAKLTHAVAVAGMLCGLAATPALADRDGHHRHWKKHHRKDHHGDWRPRHRPRDYDRAYYYYEPRVEYYSSPRLYVPVPPPPSFGLNLVFPIH
jgi:hypothetical protein